MSLDWLGRASGGVVLALLAGVGIIAFGGGAVTENQADVIPASPASFDVAEFCAEADSVTYQAEPEIGGFRSIARTATEQVIWPDAPFGQNPNATRYWLEDGKQKSEAVLVESAEAVACMRTPR